MAIKQIVEDTPCVLERNIAIEGDYFFSLQDEGQGLEVVKASCTKIEAILGEFNKHWVSLCDGDHFQIAAWYFRLANLHAHLGLVEKELARSPLVDWHKIANSMATLNVHRVAIENTLAFNGVTFE
jgi:hypothetical protein